jgi:hypothetical protein
MGRLHTAKLYCSDSNYGLDHLDYDPSRIVFHIVVGWRYEDDGAADFENLPPALVEKFLTARSDLDRFERYFRDDIMELRLKNQWEREVYLEGAQFATQEALNSARSLCNALRAVMLE